MLHQTLSRALHLGLGQVKLLDGATYLIHFLLNFTIHNASAKFHGVAMTTRGAQKKNY